MSFWIDKLSRSSLLEWPGSRILRHTIGVLAVLAGLLFGTLSLFVVPAPSARTAVEVSGTLVSVSQPHPEYGDMEIVLDGGRSYYVNRANEVAYFAWQQMLSEVQPGDRVYLTIVRPLAWLLMGDENANHLPVAGVRTMQVVYMDPAIPADTWTAQAVFSWLAGILFLVVVMCALPDLVRLFRRRPPATVVGL